MNNIKLSPNFWLYEMCKSQEADRLGIDNIPTDPNIIENLRKVCVNVLEPIRAHYGIAITPNSGYRSLPVNRAIGSKDNSQHVKGQAVDVEIPGIGNHELASWVLNNLDTDQLLLEYWYKTDPSSGWVHASYVSPEQNRHQIFTINKFGTFPGLTY